MVSKPIYTGTTRATAKAKRIMIRAMRKIRSATIVGSIPTSNTSPTETLETIGVYLVKTFFRSWSAICCSLSTRTMYTYELFNKCGVLRHYCRNYPMVSTRPAKMTKRNRRVCNLPDHRQQQRRKWGQCDLLDNRKRQGRERARIFR